MFTKKDESTKLQFAQLQLIISLIQEKYNISGDSVKSRITFDPYKLSVVLLNGLSGADTCEVDPCNKRPIEFLKAYNGEVSKEEHQQHSYWSYSVITLNQEKLSQIIEGLNLLPVPNHEPNHRMMARC